MISILKSKFLVLGFVMVAVLLIPVNDAFANHPEVTIVAADNSGIPTDCNAGWPDSTTSDCYTPSTATVDIGGVVTMINSDASGMMHTFTSGTMGGELSGVVFDSAYLQADMSYTWTATEIGTVPYYCQLHPWMLGEIIVQEDSHAAEEAAAAEAAQAAADAAAAEAAAEAAAAEAAAEQAAADTTPPVITIPELTTDQWGNENLELSMSGTTNFPTGSWTLDVTDNVGVADSACWASGGGYGDDSSNPWISSTQSYDFSKITNPPSGQKFPIGHTQISCAAYDAAGNRSESNFAVVVTHDDPIGFVQYVDKPNSFGNTADATTTIFSSANSAQSLHLLKPIADLLTASNTQGMLARDATRTLMDGALTLDDNPNNFYTGGQYTVGNTGYGIELPKPLADMLTDANMAGIADRVNPTRSWSGNGWSVEISEDVSWLSPLNAMVKICNDQGSCQENHVMKPFADMLNESNLNQAMFERSNMKILDAGGPAASTTQSSSEDTTPTLTINNFAHYNCDSPAPPNQNQNWCNGTDHYRIGLEGSTTGFSPGQPLTLKITDSNGNTVKDWNFQATVDTGAIFGAEGAVFWDGTYTEQYNGSFTVTICAPEFDVCDAESFTIDTLSSADHSNDHGLQMLTWSVNVVPPSIYQPAESIVLEMEGTLDLINTDRNHFIKFHIKNPDGVEVKTIPTYFRDGEFNTGNILIFNDFGIHSVEWTYTGTSETISIPKGFLGTFEVVDYSADTTPPVITVPSDQTFTTTDPAGYVYDFSVSATDNVAIDIYGPSNAGPGIFCVDLITNSTSPPGTLFPVGTGDSNHVVCSVADTNGNHASATFIVTVIYEAADTTPSQSYTVLVNEMGGSIAANDPGGCASFNPQTCYTPSDITINVGDSVTWVNNDSTNNWYTLMGNWGSLASSSGDNACDGPGKLALDMCGVSGNDRTSWTHTFDAVGTYNYHDWVYQNSAQRPEGVVNVVASGAPAPVTPVTPIQTADHTITTVEEFNVTATEKVIVGDLLKIDIIASHKTSIQIEISDTEGNSIHELTCTTTTEFICETYWSVPNNTLPGTYFIIANSTTSSDLTTFEIIEILEPTDKDTTPPTLTQNQNITLDATTSNGAIVTYESPQVTDDDSGVELGPDCSPASGSFFPLGTTGVTCYASDWAENIGTTSFTVTVNSLIAAPIEITTDVSITIGKSQYNTDEAIFVTGVATPFTENNVSIQVEDSSDNVVLVEQITPESSGIYTGIIFPNFLWSTSGNYTMSATYGNSTANTSFGFEFLEPVIDEYLSPTGITLQTDTSMYTIGDTIIIESALTDVGSDYQIGIFVEDPTGELRSMQFLNTDDSGSVSLSLKAQDNWIPGKYLVGAYDVLDNSATIRDEVYFDIVKPIPEITISPTVTTTESGNAITSYDAGDMAYFSTSLLSESTSDVLVTINVVDSDDTTLGVAFFKSIIGKGDSELVLGFKIPEDAADGTAKIYVNTYTDWIDQGGIVIGSELLSEVNIEGVIIEVVEETVIEEVVEETVLPENTIPRLSTVTDITQPASFTTGSVVSYSLPFTVRGATTLDVTCTPAPGSMFPIGSTQVTCTATNDFGNTGMTSFMVTINPILQTADQSLSVKVGKDLYNNLEPLFVTGSVGTVTGEPINLEVRDTQNNLISIEQTTPKESGVYSTVLTSNELWDNTGEYTIIAKYEGVIALDTFEFKLVEVEEVIPEKIPTSLFIDTLDSAYVLGDVVGIGVNLVDAGAGESILLEIKDSQNDQVLIQSLNTDSDGIAVFLHQLDSSGEPGVYSVTAVSDEWSFSNSENFIAVAQIPDITIGDVVPTLQDGTEVDSFESGDMGYFQTPVISESVSDVLITVNIFDVENTPLGLAYFNSKVVDDTFDITLGLQIPQDAAPGLATVYINTYTDWPTEGGVPILEEQVSFIEITPSSTTSLTVSSDESEPTTEVELIPITGNISVNTESTSYTTGNTIVISGSIQNLTEYEQPVVILIVSPDGNLVTIDQVSHDSSGNYSTTVTAGGTMNSNGEYEIRAQYGASTITSTFDFTSN